ncbi:MAG: helical backbone metal receptor [Myxococcales bacterium]
MSDAARRLSLMAALVIALMTGCRHRTQGGLTVSGTGGGGDAATVGPLGQGAFTDEAGRRVVPRAFPTRRVVSLAPNVTELLFLVGAGEQVVGVDNYSDQPAGRVERIARVGSDYEPSLETIVALTPDVVFTSLSANRRETVEALERLGIPVFVTDTRALSEMDRILKSLGEITGRSAAAEKELRQLHAGLAAVSKRVAGLPRQRVLVVVWGDPLYVAGRQTFTDDLVAIAGGTNIAADATGFAKYPLERVLRLSPQVIVLPTHSAVEQGPRAVGYWSRWPDLPAVRDHRVRAVEDTLIIRPGAHLVQGAETLAEIIHPRL